MSFNIYDNEKGIWTSYWVYFEGVSLDFGTSWTSGSEVRIFTNYWRDEDAGELCRRYNCPRSLALAPSTPFAISAGSDILVRYVQCDDGQSHAGIIGGWNDIEALARNVEYQDGISHLEIVRELVFVTSKARFMVFKTHEYHGAQFFKLSVVIENIHRDDLKRLLEYQQQFTTRVDLIVDRVPCPWRGSEHVIEQMPKSPWQNDGIDVTNDIRQAAHDSFPLAFKYADSQSEAIKQGLLPDDFQWEFPNHHEIRIVRSPSVQTDTPRRALRLDIHLNCVIIPLNEVADVFISSIEFNITSMTRSPSHSNTFSACTLRLDAPHAALANATIPNHSSQIVEISTDSRSAERLIASDGLTQTITVNIVQVMAPVAGDVFAGPIHGGNNGGRNNTNNITMPTSDTPSRRKGGVSLLRRFEFLPGLRGIFRPTKRREGEARVQEGANSV